MLDDLFALSQRLLKINNREYKRYFLKQYDFSNRLSILSGQRGIGKTTVITQYVLDTYRKKPFTKKALYIQADHFLVNRKSLYEIAEEFVMYGGELLCIDEIHKYTDWAMELKSIYDTFPTLKVIVSGSSVLQINKGSHDLSRRAVQYKMHGLSFREFLEIILKTKFPILTLNEILTNHQRIAEKVIKTVESKNNKVLVLFKQYLEHGYYPYFSEYKDKLLFARTLEQSVHTTLESDLISVYPELNGITINKISKLLSIIASMVPFTPDMASLKKMLSIGDERTLKMYLKYLEDAGIIHLLMKGKRNLGQLEKPEKIYLNNANLIYTLTNKENINIGNLRETLFLSACSPMHSVTSTPVGDFLLNDKVVVEVGGKSKTFRQIKNVADSYLALDDIEIGINNKIPLYLFAMQY